MVVYLKGFLDRIDIIVSDGLLKLLAFRTQVENRWRHGTDSSPKPWNNNIVTDVWSCIDVIIFSFNNYIFAMTSFPTSLSLSTQRWKQMHTTKKEAIYMYLIQFISIFTPLWNCVGVIISLKLVCVCFCLCVFVSVSKHKSNRTVALHQLGPYWNW